jgi:hypothetical protein
MRFHHLMAIALLLVVGISVTRFLSGATAEANADAAQVSGLDVSSMYVDTPRPAENMHDGTFVFAPRD